MIESDAWKGGPLLREALVNVFGAGSRFRALAIIAVVAGAGLAAVSAIDSVALQRELHEDALANRNLVSISAGQGNAASISRASCEDLVHDPDVTAAGMLFTQPTEDFVQLGSEVPVFEASQSLVPQLNSAGAVIGHGLASRFAGDLKMPDGTVLLARLGVEQPDALSLDTAVTVAIPASVKSGSSCYVVLSQYARVTRVDTRLISELRWSGTSLVAEPQYQEAVNPIDQYLARLTLYLPFAIGLLLGLSAGIVNRARATEWATYRLSGTSPRSAALLMFLEQAHLAAAFALSGCLATVVFGLNGLETSESSVVISIVCGATLWLIATAISGYDLVLRAPTTLVKEK
jgi:hypothetical protein